MAIPAKKFRELVFQMLYSFDMGRATDESMIPLLAQELATTKNVVKQAQERVHQIRHHLDTLDSLITNASHAYAFERIQSTERNILRLAIFELLFDETIPNNIVITEAIRLTKKFSTKEAAAFVHAIIDAIIKNRQGEQIDALTIEESAKALNDIEAISQEASLQSPHQEKEEEE